MVEKLISVRDIRTGMRFIWGDMQFIALKNAVMSSGDYFAQIECKKVEAKKAKDVSHISIPAARMVRIID